MTRPLSSTRGNGRYVAAEDDYTIGTARGWAGEKPRLVYCHGATSTALEVLTHPEQVALIQALAQDYLVTVADLGYDPYGSDLGVTRIGQVLDWQASAFGATGPAVLVGASGGVLNAMNYAKRFPEDLSAVVGIIPALDILDIYTQNPSLQAGIDSAYGGTYIDATHGPDHSPVQFADELDPDLPIALFYASNDTMARPVQVFDFADARPRTSVTSVGALGHTNAAIAAAQSGVLAFLESI